MTLISFQRHTDHEGWRWSQGWRTRRTEGEWEVQRWNGEHWVPMRRVATYAEARESQTWFDRMRHFGDAD